MTILATNLGFPRIGGHRELKTAVESYWAGKSPVDELLKTAASLRARHWLVQQKAGIDHIPSNDFWEDSSQQHLWLPFAIILQLLHFLLTDDQGALSEALKTVEQASLLDQHCTTGRVGSRDLCDLIRIVFGNPFQPTGSQST